jgi:hypothetical protein
MCLKRFIYLFCKILSFYQTSINAFTEHPLTSKASRNGNVVQGHSFNGLYEAEKLDVFLLKSSCSRLWFKGPQNASSQKSAASVSNLNASNAKYKSDIARSSSDIDPPKTPESRLTDLRALNSSAADSTRSVAWSHSKGGSTPPTSDPIPIEQDEDEDVVMLSNEGNHVTSIKSVSNIYI